MYISRPKKKIKNDNEVSKQCEGVFSSNYPDATSLTILCQKANLKINKTFQIGSWLLERILLASEALIFNLESSDLHGKILYRMARSGTPSARVLEET